METERPRYAQHTYYYIAEIMNDNKEFPMFNNVKMLTKNYFLPKFECVKSQPKL